MQQPKRILSVFSLVMINVIAVDSLRTLPIGAALGVSLVFYYLVAALAFFIPVALVSAELATTFPNTGGIYVWVREAFGRRYAFITIWLQWIYNVVWYPTIMAFIAVTIAYLVSPMWATNKLYLLSMIISLFWLFTLLNCLGMHVSSIVSTIGALIGTLLPMLGLIGLGIFWLVQGNSFSGSPHLPPLKAWIPDFSSLGHLSLFVIVLFGLIGMEMSAVHAEEVKNPQRDYPRALLYSTILIFSTLVLGSLAIVVIVPTENLSVVSGMIEAARIIFNAYHMPWMTSVTAIFIVVGSLSGVSAWILGPAKGLLVSARDGCIPLRYAKVNSRGAPVQILIAQAMLFTLLSLIFILIDSVNAAYVLLSALCSQLALVVYIVMFAAAIRLRQIHPNKHRAFKIPGGQWGIWIIATLGIICCVSAILIGFVPPTQIPIGNSTFYEAFLISGFVIFLVVPWLLIKNKENNNG